MKINCTYVKQKKPSPANIVMAYLLPHLHSGWEVDQAILNEEDRVVVIRWGRDHDSVCMVQDEVCNVLTFVKICCNWVRIYLIRTRHTYLLHD